MKHTFILEDHIPNGHTDRSLFKWAKKIESLGYEVSQIWENEDEESEYNYGTKGINFSMTNNDFEGIELCLFEGCDNNSDIRLQVDYDFLTQAGYINLIKSLVRMVD